MVVVFERLHDRREVQTLKPCYLDNIVLQTPVLCLEWDDVVDVFEQARDGVCLCAVRVRYIPEYICGRKTIPLYRQSEAHLGRVMSRAFAAF